MDIFAERYNRLNPAQREAVDTIEGPVMVIAGPGTGKTSILTLRIANILKKTDTPPSGILAITFTDAGVKAMRQKLREIIGVRADEVRIHTFHSFAASLISEHGEYFTHLSRSELLTDIEAEDFIREILTDAKFSILRPLGDPEYYVRKILGTISDSKREAWTGDMIRSFVNEEIKKIKNDEDSISTRGATKGALKADALKRIERCEKTILFTGVYEAYENKKREKRRHDYDDLIIEVLVALKKDELFLRLVQEKCLYILVDEHQDTNDSQNLLIRTIADFFENPNLFIVGDEKQAIYRFQGASVQNFLAFEKTWPEIKTIALSSNYRSHQNILDAGFSLIEKNYTDGEHTKLRIPLVSDGKSDTKPIEVVSAGNIEAVEEYMSTNIKEIISKNPHDTIAVIVRTNKDVEKALGAISSRGIEAISERSADIFSHPIGVLFFNLIEFLHDASNTESLAKTIAGGLWNLPFNEVPLLIKDIRGGLLKDISKKISGIRELIRDANELDPISYIIRSGNVSGLVELASRKPLSMEVWRGIVSLAQMLSSQKNTQNPRELLSVMLSYKISSEKRSIKLGFGVPGGRVTVMTAHGSKGLEFDNVYMPYATEESWSSKAHKSTFVLPREKNDGDEIKDSRRLFYVAITRARKHVTVFVPNVGIEGRELTPLRFINDIDAKNIVHIDIPSVNEVATNILLDSETKRIGEIRNHAKRSILENGVSATALNHFVACPNKFYYKSILRVPEPPLPSSEKGNAMHEAISHVWKIEVKNKDSISRMLEENIRAYMEKSLLITHEKEACLKELVTDIPTVASALLSHFNQEGVVSTETWMEMPFEVSLGKEVIQTRLHGKLDAVLEQENSVSVFDYKTKQARSINEIKGETKNSDGGYFRQLVFYKLLISSQEKYKGKKVEPSLVFVKPDGAGRCPTITLPIENGDKEIVKKALYDLVSWVFTGPMPSVSCDDVDCEWCKLSQLTK